MFVALLPTLKIFLFVEINSEVIEAIARSCSFKKVVKISKISLEIPLFESLF